MQENIVNQWLASYAATAVDGDLDIHMSHISKEVQVYGVKGFDVVTYDDWRNQCAQEFPQKLIKSLDYDNISIRPDDGGQRIVFLAQEKITTNEGKVIRQPLEMVLDQNEEEVWLLKQLRILDENQAGQAGL